MRRCSHAARLFGIHSHWLLAEYVLAAVQSCEGDLAVSYHRRDDADQIDIIPLNHATPIVRHVRNAELTRDRFRVRASSAGDRHELRVLAVHERGDLGRTREARADNAYANFVIHIEADYEMAGRPATRRGETA